MGLRMTLILALAGILVLLGMSATLLFQEQLRVEAAVADRSGAEKDMKRLLLALDQQIAELDIVLGSWANYTSFYEHAAHPSEAFRRDELSADALTAAHFDWISLIADDARVVDHGEVPQGGNELPVQAFLNDVSSQSVIAATLRKVVSQKIGCSIVAVGTRLAIACFRPLLTTDAKGPARGTVMIGRWVSPEMLAKVSSQTGLQFSVSPVNSPAVVSESPLLAQFATGKPALVEEAERVVVTASVAGMHRAQVAEVRLDWPRESAQRIGTTLRRVALAMAVMIGLTAVIMIVIADHLLVRRLSRIRLDLGEIIKNENWGGNVRISRNDELTQLANYINEVVHEVRNRLAELRERSLTDTLTGLPNRRHFDERLTSTLAQFRRDGKTGALVLFDIDNFKRYNDAYGHPCGDDVLAKFARCMATAARRPVDLPARLGGEEFAILMPLTGAEGAVHCANAARLALQELKLAHSGNEAFGVVTVSAGLTLLVPGDTAESIYSRADTALYEAKHSGRNKVVVRMERSGPGLAGESI